MELNEINGIPDSCYRAKMPEDPKDPRTLDYAAPSPQQVRSQFEVPIGFLLVVLAPFAALSLFLGIWGCIAMITDSIHFDESEKVPTFARLVVGAVAALICVAVFRRSRKTK